MRYWSKAQTVFWLWSDAHFQESSSRISNSILDRYQAGDTEIFLLELLTEGLKSGEYFLYLFAKDRFTQSRSGVNTAFKVK
ncbi:MAG: hypothetical protein OEY18_15245, partial [Candidatus Aminicenantes bacterium]|nr:hypothetical protein [Candidatus Aminicenantes bacterium]